MRLFYAFIMIWCVTMIISFLTSPHVGIFGPLVFLIFVLLFIWAVKKFRQEGRRKRELRKAWRNNPNNWSV